MGEKKQTPKTNSVVRALTVLKILQEKTDKDHALEQSAILDYIINDENCYSTDKTLNGDIKNLMAFLIRHQTNTASRKMISELYMTG